MRQLRARYHVRNQLRRRQRQSRDQLWTAIARSSNRLITTDGGDFSFTTANQLLDVINVPAGALGYNRAFFYFEIAATGGVIQEPATWGLMIAGFGLVGASLRRRSAATA